MKWFNHITLTLALALLVSTAFAQETALADAVMKKLQAFSDKTTSITCRFEQVKTMEFVKDPLVSSGRFYYFSPDNIRWDQTVPEEYILLISGEEMKIKKDGKEKTHDLDKSRAMDAFRDMLLGIINGKILKSKQFAVKYFETDTDYVLHLTPESRAGKQQFSLIKLNFSKTDMSLKTISMKEKDGNQALISMSDPVFNETIAADRFTKF